ncbi:MAG: diguanylate cyclase/phosphodiesterase with sensor [Rhizobacter sp.]|nr:diguanylate cyclase/phosphodiesterase with sensor [Rhizobacter sp.]
MRSPADPLPPRQTALDDATRLPRRAGRLVEPMFMFPAIALLLLLAVWVGTFNLIRLQRTAARHTAETSARELSQTYDAQVMRALREIDQTLKFVKYSYETGNRGAALDELKARALLPPDLLFTVSVADETGTVVASTNAANIGAVCDAANFDTLRQKMGLHVGLPRKRAGTDEFILQFSRRLRSSDGRFAGVVLISADAAYFVSGYETSQLGQHGFLGVLGEDGVFRVARSGDAVSAGGHTDYARVVPDGAEETSRLTDAWDGERRYTSARPLFGFPMAVIVGLSEAEQLAVVRHDTRTYFWRAGSGSVAIVLLAALLTGLSSQLVRVRRRAVQAQVAHAARVEHLAYHDGLTSLPNRRMFSALLDRQVTLARQQGRQLAVLFIDLDGFRPINDSFGHATGDRVLTETASRLRAMTSLEGAVARVGGDGFLLLMQEARSVDDCARLARRAIDALERPFDLDGHRVQLSASVGIAIFPDHGDPDDLIVHADAAMYTAKRAGGGAHALFDPAVEGSALEQLSLLSDLRQAIDLGQLTLHYQPKVDGRRGEIRGVEALLRWRHPTRGMVSPVDFIPVAERFGLIHDLGNWVIDEACRQLRAWLDAGLRLRVAINVSAHQLRKNDLLSRIEQALARHRVDASQLQCEITESVVMEDVKTTLRVFEALERIGVELSIDDFGTGYSSLAYLRELPARQLKIDRSFVNDLVGSADARAIVDAVIRLAHALGLLVVAEGVETAEQRDVLLELDCDELQGYFFARPMTADSLLAWVGGDRPDGAVGFSASVLDTSMAGG